MLIDAYHGTTAENVAGIARSGLRKGSWVSPALAVAEHFARQRAAWNGEEPVIYRVRVRVRAIRKDRSGRLEASIAKVVTCVRILFT